MGSQLKAGTRQPTCGEKQTKPVVTFEMVRVRSLLHKPCYEALSARVTACQQMDGLYRHTQCHICMNDRCDQTPICMASSLAHVRCMRACTCALFMGRLLLDAVCVCVCVCVCRQTHVTCMSTSGASHVMVTVTHTFPVTSRSVSSG